MDNRRNDSIVVLVAGLDHVIHKVLNQANSLRDKNIETVFFSRDFSSYSLTLCNKFGFPLVKEVDSSILSLISFIKAIYKYKITHVEFYLSSKSINLLTYYLISLILRMPIFVWARGGELAKWNQHSLPRKLIIRMIISSSKAFFFKEIWMPEKIRHLKLNEKQLVFMPNRVKVYRELPTYQGVEILFLNTFHPIRDPMLFVKTAYIYHNKYSKFEQFRVVGLSGHKVASRSNAEQEVVEYVQKHDMGTYLHLHEWTNEPRKYFEKAKIFVLPAKVVFANFALLEAMERGVIPIITDLDPSGSKIVENEKCGLVVHHDPEAIAERIDFLMRHRERANEMASLAREKIETEYNLETNVELLKGFYNKSS